MYIYIYIYVCVCVWESRQFPPGPIEKMKPGKHRSTHKKVPTRYKEIHSERESDRYNVIEIYMYMLYRVSQIDNVSSRDLYSVQSPTLRRVDICIYICIYSVQRPTLRICIYIYIYLSTYIIYLYIYIYLYIHTYLFHRIHSSGHAHSRVGVWTPLPLSRVQVWTRFVPYPERMHVRHGA